MFGAFVEGWRRVLRAPALAIWVLLALLLASIPLAIKPGELVGGGLVATARSGLSVTTAAWSAELPSAPPSPGAALFDALLGAGHTITAPFLLFWLFLSGGLLDRLARGRRVGTAHFFAISGVFLVRFIRLGVLVAGVYFLLFRVVRPQLPGRSGALAFLAALALVNLVADFAKVRAVVEDRRSMLGAVLASMRFIRTHPIGTIGLFTLHVLLAVGVLMAWPHVAPGAIQSQWLAVGPPLAYLLIIVAARLAFMASEVAYFQSQLAHASYAAMPEPVWPDSPAVEAIQNFTARVQRDARREKHEPYERPEGSSW